jgi:hypothetical protein
MGFKSGFFLGLLAGAAAAAASRGQEMAEAPTGASDEYGADAASGSQAHLRETLVKVRKQADEALGSVQQPLKDTLVKVRKQADEALAAAQETATEKEKELRQRFDSLVRKSE